MNTIIRREPVINRQKAIIASRLIVHADSAAAAARALNAVADLWPASHDVWVSLVGADVDEALLDWQAPPNALLGIPSRLFGTPAGEALAARFHARETLLLLDDYDPAFDVPSSIKLRFALADAHRYPHLPVVPAMPIATGLVDQDEFADAVDHGYVGAAGWFLLRGNLPSSTRLNPSHAQIIHILNQVRQNADVSEIETTLKQNISISFKLLRYINSAGFGLAKQIESFRHAVTLLGYDKLNKWLSLLLVTASRDPAAPALMQTAIARGRFMELTAADKVDRKQLDNLFIAGSFSLLDVLLGTRIDAVLKEMNLPAAICEALLARGGPYAPWLDFAIACEQADEAELAARAAALGVPLDLVNRAQVGALAFAESLQLD
ncbi:MAG: EAL and HDOD domain-containing protein [Ignavibacteria bacterium]